MHRAIVLLALSLALALAPGCRQAPAASPAPVVDTHTALRDQARLVLESRCGSCHISTYATAAPPALAVFDLLDADWSRKMTDGQLGNTVDRLKTGGGDVEAPLPTEAQTRVVARYIEAELERRGGRPSAHSSPAAR